MKILIATHNPAKKARYEALLKDIPDIELISLNDLNITEKVEEPYSTARENAIHKATEYAKLSYLITIGVDEAAYTNFLPKGEQPGVYVRRLTKGRELSDEEILDEWKKIFSKYPNKPKTMTWDYYIAFYNPNTKDLGTSNPKAISKITEKISKTILPGYPMSSFLILPGSTKPHSELSEAEKLRVDQGIFSNFVADFSKWIKAQK